MASHAGPKPIDWVRLINYLETVARRTHENLPVALTLVVRPGTGHGDITHPRLQRFFDRLAASPFTFTYLAVDSDLRLIDYGSVDWSQVNNNTSYNSIPNSCIRSNAPSATTSLSATSRRGAS